MLYEVITKRLNPADDVVLFVAQVFHVLQQVNGCTGLGDNRAIGTDRNNFV